jgi:hypothetical protein
MEDAPIAVLLSPHQPGFRQELQGGVHNAGAGGILATRPLLQRFDDLVAVIGTASERIEQQKFRLTAPRPSAAPSVRRPMVMVRVVTMTPAPAAFCLSIIRKS